MEVAKAELKETASLVTVPVALEGRRQVEVYSRVAGRVKTISRDVGAKVAAGQMLFSVDRSEPGDTFLAVPVQSPINGTVAQWFVSPGDQIGAADRAVLVVDDSSLRARINLAVQEWQGVTPRTEVTLEVDGQSRQAKVVSVARAVQATSGKGLVEVEIPNPKSDWKAGMGATAVVKVAPRPRMVVSARALLITSDGAFLYTVEDGIAHRKKVTFTPRTPDEVELTGDTVKDGSLVVVTGASRLSEGAKVQIASENGEKPAGAQGEKPASAQAEAGEKGKGEGK